MLRLRDEGLEWRELEGEVLALDRSQQIYLSVNRTGTVLWPALAEGATREQLLARLAERFDAGGTDGLERDLDVFLASLDAQNLLVRGE